jgi:hypothetical protein
MTNRRGFLPDFVSNAFSASEAADRLQKSFPGAPLNYYTPFFSQPFSLFS